MNSLREELLSYHKWLIQEMLVDCDDDSEFTVDNYLEAINSYAQDESPTVGDNEAKEKKCNCGKSVPRECDGNCIWDGMGYR